MYECVHTQNSLGIFFFLINRKELTSSGGPTKFEIHIVAQFDNHNSQVWRVSWNITGTVLASSGDDGCVRLWKGNISVEELLLYVATLEFSLRNVNSRNRNILEKMSMVTFKLMSHIVLNLYHFT